MVPWLRKILGAENHSHFVELQSRFADLERRYRILTDNLAAAVLIRDDRGRITYCSPYTEVLTGYARSEVYAASDDFFLSIVHFEDRERYQRGMQINRFGESFQFRFRFVHKSGLEMWAETRVVPVLEEHSEGSDDPTSLSIVLDVTAAVRYQQQVEEKNRDLQDFTYMISHDLKAPLFTIKGMLSAIQDDFGLQLAPTVNQYLAHVGKATQRLDRLITSVTSYAKLSAEEVSAVPTELNAVLRDVQHDLSTQIAESGVQIAVGNLPTVIGDGLKLYQIFSNLVGNAIKYRDPHRPATIEITAKHSTLPHHVIIEVSDNGSGIPEGRLKEIFRPFQRAHSTEIEGSGIGLASVKRMLDKLGGTISVESTVGVGSCFRVCLRER